MQIFPASNPKDPCSNSLIAWSFVVPTIKLNSSQMCLDLALLLPAYGAHGSAHRRDHASISRASAHSPIEKHDTNQRLGHKEETQ